MTFPAPPPGELQDGVLPPDPEAPRSAPALPAGGLAPIDPDLEPDSPLAPVDADDVVRPPGEGPVAYETLRAELAADVDIPDRTWDVDTRPGYSARFRVDLEDREFQRLRRACRMKGKRNVQTGEYEVDELKLSRLVLATYNTGLFRNGTLIEDDNGDPMVFRSPEFLAIFGSTTAGDAVGKFYGIDGGVISAGRALIQASGWMDDPDEAEVGAGPTGGSSTG